MSSTRQRTAGGVFAILTAIGLVTAMLVPAARARPPVRSPPRTGRSRSAGSGSRRTSGTRRPAPRHAFGRANENNEVKGYTFDYAGFADDKNDRDPLAERGAW